MTRTKIVATIGPSSNDRYSLEKMLRQGMSAARLNLTHSTHKEQSETISKLRKLSEDLQKPLAIIADTKGPEIQAKPSSNKKLTLSQGQKITISPSSEMSNPADLIVDFPHLHKYVNEGNIIFLGDGEIELKILDADFPSIECEALNGGSIEGKKGIHIPQIKLPLPTITKQDKQDIKFAVNQGVDWIALSFVQNVSDIREAKELLKSLKDEDNENPTLIIAKIETTKAVENIDEILDEADGLMVARGDLGMAVDMEDVPFIQKKIIRMSNCAAKPVITATQMLESMIDFPSPTRAEVTDVANAVLDGTDAVMLSAETAIGSYPVKTVSTMNKIAQKAESHQQEQNSFMDGIGTIEGTAPAIGRAACSIAKSINAAAIITSTRSGYTARLVSRFRRNSPIFAITPSPKVYNQLSLVWGVTPLEVNTTANNTDEMIKASISTAGEKGYLEKGDRVVVTAGIPFAVRGTTNLIKVEEV